MASAYFWCKGNSEQKHDGRYAAMSFVNYAPDGQIPEESLTLRRE